MDRVNKKIILDLRFRILELKSAIRNLQSKIKVIYYSLIPELHYFNCRRSKLSSQLIVIFFLAVFHPGFVHASQKTVKIFKEYHGNFVTTVKGKSQSQLPYIKVIRSKEGITYLFNKFRKIRKLTTHNKALYLERELLKNNFSARMVVAIFSHPTDNYKFEKVKIVEHENDQRIEVKVSYFHKNKEYSVPPFKSIFYRFYVVKQSHLPVVLMAGLAQKKISKPRKKSFVTVYGTLQNWKDNGKQLALINKSKRKKRVYYIKGALQKELEQYIGKFMGLRGEVTLDSESIYEADFLVKKIVKVY